MSSKTDGDLVREQGQEIAKLGLRMDHFQQNLDRFERNLVEAEKVYHDVQTKFAVTLKDVDRLEKKIEELHSRRWEIWKLVLAALVGAILSGGVGIVAKIVERNLQIEPFQGKR